MPGQTPDGTLATVEYDGQMMHVRNSITEIGNPVSYRLRRDSYGGFVLQGLFATVSQAKPRTQYTWRDLPTVESDLKEEPYG